jgi:plastocyanin
MRRHRILHAAVLTLIAAVVLAGCGKQNFYGSATEETSSPPAAASPEPSRTKAADAGVTVTIQNLTFVPQTLTVEAGTKVTWTNNDTTLHDVTSADGPAIDAVTTDLFSSGTMQQGDSFSYTFTEPGTYYYVCTIHASMATMHAKVVVL